MRRAPTSVPRSARRTLSRPALLVTTICTAALALPTAASAATQGLSGDGSADPSARIVDPLAPSTRLPEPTAHAARFSTDDASGTPARHWLFGARGDRARLAAIALAHGGSFNATLGVLSVPSRHAAAVAGALGRTVTWAGPDVPAQRNSSFEQPGNVQSPWSRSVALAPSLTPAPGTLARIGIVDDAVDHRVAELASADVINGVSPSDPHGTMVASTAAAPYDGVGVVGVAPGAPVLSWGTTLTCNDVSSGIVNLVRRGAQVINMSLGFTEPCFPLWQAISFAYASHVTMVVASGNDGYRGNPLSFPASYPHVITASAVKPTLTAASFSNYNEYVDIAAPGVRVPVDVPRRFDRDDGVRDGRTVASGTSFASPFVAGGVSWILGANPALDPSQVAAVLRAGARDLSQPGWDSRTGFGLLQIAPSMAATPPAPDLLEPNDFPAFARSSGIFKQLPIWSGGPAASFTATGDSADDDIDAYRVKVPAHTGVSVSVTPSAGETNLFAFDSGVRVFTGKPLDSSTLGGPQADRITLRNTGDVGRVAFVVVNTVSVPRTRSLSQYSMVVEPLAPAPAN